MMTIENYISGIKEKIKLSGYMIESHEQRMAIIEQDIKYEKSNIEVLEIVLKKLEEIPLKSSELKIESDLPGGNLKFI